MECILAWFTAKKQIEETFSVRSVAILCIFWDVGWEWFHDTEDWKDWNWNQDPGCPKIKKMTWRFCFFKKSLGVLDVLLQNTKGGWNPLSEFESEENCGIGTLEYPCQRQSRELLYCGCCSCLGTFWTRSWHGRSPVCHDCVDHVLNHFWPILSPAPCFPDSSLKINGFLSVCARWWWISPVQSEVRGVRCSWRASIQENLHYCCLQL